MGKKCPKKNPVFFAKQVIARLLNRRESYWIHDCQIFAAIHLSPVIVWEFTSCLLNFSLYKIPLSTDYHLVQNV